METDSPLFDVAVLGGGPAGTASAIKLARLGRKVVVIEQSAYDSPRIGETLPPHIKPILYELGVWHSFMAANPVQSNGIKSSWGGQDLSESSFIFSPYGFGWHIDRQRFDKMLSDAAVSEGAIVLTNSKIINIKPDPKNGWSVEFRRKDDTMEKSKVTSVLSTSRNSSVHSKAIINALGRNSIFVRQLGAKNILYDNLMGIAVRFRAEEEQSDPFALIEASENGWWYSAFIPETRLIVIFMTNTDMKHLRQMGEWIKQLHKTRYTKSRCSGYIPVSGPRTFSASTRRLKKSSYRDGWLAVGDASLAADPLSGSGINFALRSGYYGALALNLWLCGDRYALKNYEEHLDMEFYRYLKNKAYYYNLETRWPQSTFWKQRSTCTNGFAISN
jgi:flavin-dependent dehydrogenase